MLCALRDAQCKTRKSPKVYNSFIHLASDFVTHKGFWGPRGGQTSEKTVLEGGEHPIPFYEQVNRVLAVNKPSKVSILVSLKAVIFFFPA